MNRLAILICHLPERHDKLKRLTNILDPQIERFKDRVYYSIHDGSRHLSTGAKRNQLIEQTDSEFFCAIDDDDTVPGYYIDEIVRAMDQNPDVITFNGIMTTNGAKQEHWTIKLGSKYEEKNGHYYRWPNHIVPMKRERVRHIKFPEVWIQEDYIWSKKIHDLGLLKTEVYIDKDLYHYQVETKVKAETVYHRRGLR